MVVHFRVEKVLLVSSVVMQSRVTREEDDQNHP